MFIEAHGYEVTPLEYVSPIDTPKNLMIRAIKKSNSNEKAREEYNNIKSYLMLAQLWKNTFIDIDSLKDGGINEKTKYLYRH